MKKAGSFLLITGVLLTACAPQTEPPEQRAESADIHEPIEPTSAQAADESPDEDASGLPETDIAVADVTWQDGLPVISTPLITTRAGLYDNQPAFDARGGFYFTTETPGNQTDIRYMDANGSVSSFTNTPDESEYSPRPSPDGQSVSYIHQQPGDIGGQVYRTRVDGSVSGPVHDYGPSGYYALSGDQSQMLLFALTDPFTLRWADNQRGLEQQIASEPGRALYSSPDGQLAYFTLANPEGGFTVNAFAFADRSITTLFNLPGESQDYAVFLNPAGDVSWFAVENGTLVYRDSGQQNWQPIADLTAMGLTGTSRMAVSPQADRIALVVEEQN